MSQKNLSECFIQAGQYKAYYFDESQSCENCKADDDVTMINAPLLSFVYLLKSKASFLSSLSVSIYAFSLQLGILKYHDIYHLSFLLTWSRSYQSEEKKFGRIGSRRQFRYKVASYIINVEGHAVFVEQ